MRSYYMFFLGLFMATSAAWAQPGIEVSGSYFLGFQDHSLSLWNDQPVSEYTAKGYRGRISFTYRFADSLLEGQFALGLRTYDFEGSFQDKPFTGNATRVLNTIGMRFWAAENWATGLHWVTENNRNEEDLRSATSENFRYNVEVELLYRIYRGLGASLHYSKIVYPRADHYLIYNPSDQVMIGINYHFF